MTFDNEDETKRVNPKQMEQGKPPLDISLYEMFQGAFSSRLTPLRATKITLVDISHSLEELVIADRLPAMVFTGFQQSSYWYKETARYLALAGIVHSVSIFAGGLPPETLDSNYIHVNLSYKDTLRQEWFLLVLTKHFSALLCGRDRLEQVENEAERAFDTLWTFEPDLIQDLVLLLAKVIEHYRPERHQQLMDGLANFPPVQPDARYVTLLTSRVVNHLERQYQAQRQQADSSKSALASDQEIDTALLPLFAHTYLLLLLGWFDEGRAGKFGAKIVADMLNFKAKHLFIDLTKLGGIEPQAAVQLVRTVRELGVCGVKVALTGIQPDIAAVLIDQNLDLPNLITYTTLEDGLRAVMS